MTMKIWLQILRIIAQRGRGKWFSNETVELIMHMESKQYRLMTFLMSPTYMFPMVGRIEGARVGTDYTNYAKVTL